MSNLDVTNAANIAVDKLLGVPEGTSHYILTEAMNIIADNIGASGGIPNPDIGTLLNNEMTKFDETTGKIVGTGDINTDSTVDFAPKTIISGAGSIQLKEVHRISSGGENVFFKNLATGISYVPTWVGIKDQSIVANQDSTGLIPGSQRTYSENMLSVDQGGIISPTNITDYADNVTIAENISVHGVRFRLGEPLAVGNILHYAVYFGSDNAGIQLTQFDKVIETPFLAGDFYDLWFISPSETFGGITTFAEIILETELGSGITSALQVYATDSDPTEHYAQVNLREFSDVEFISEEDVNVLIDAKLTSGVKYKGKYNATTNVPNLTIVPTGVLTGNFYVVEIAGTFFGLPVEVGDALISEVDDPSVVGDWTILNRNLDATTIKTLYESNANTNAYTDLEKSKLLGVEPLSEVNQSDSEIKTQYENNANTNAFTDTEKSSLGNQTGTNTGDVILSASDTTQESVNLSGQELTINQATETTDGVMAAEDKLKLNNVTGNGISDHWTSGLDVTEQSPKDQTVLYTAGTYLINGNLQTIATGGTYDLENGYLAVNHYTGLTSYQHRFVLLCVDSDKVIKSIGGLAADKKEVPELPIAPNDSVCIAVIEIKVDNSVVPKDIKNKEITDTRNAPAFNTDEFVKVSADDLGAGHLIDKISSNGNVTPIIENVGGIETIRLDASGGSSEYGELYVTVRGNMVAGTTPSVIEFDTAGVSSGITVDAVNNRINILSTGVHRISYNGSVFLKKNETYFAHIYVNGLNIAEFGEVFTSLDNLTHPFGFSRPIQLTAGDYVEIFTSCTASKDFDLSPGSSFNIEKM